MERLEAALAKAREMRRSAGSDAGISRTGKPLAQPERDALWTNLPEISISAEKARASRVTAISGGIDAAPYDLLRSRTIRQMKEKKWTRLAITSPDPGCGKSTVSVNLALSLARQRDLRVMLFDLDLRRPALDRILGMTGKTSFWECLEGKHEFGEIAVRIGDNLAIAVNHAPCRNPAELLQSAGAREVLDRIEATFKPDVMIFDMSPMLASDDNVGFLHNSDCALLIAAAERTRMSNIDLCEKELAHLTNVLGVVLNKCRYMDETQGYSYGTY